MAQSRTVACGWLVTLLLASSMVAGQAQAPTPLPPPAGPIDAAEIDALLKQFNVPGVGIAVIQDFKIH